MSPFSLPLFPVCWVPGEYITTVSFFPWVCLIHYQKFLLIKWDCIMVPRAWHGPPPAPSWWQQRTSQPLTPVASPGRRGRRGPSCWACAVTGALIALGAFCLFPFGGLGQLVLGLPACLARSREAGDFLCQLKTRFRYPSCWSVNTLQIIGSCTTYQLVIKLLPGPAEEIAAGWPSSA